MLFLTQKIFALSLIVQSLEFLALKMSYNQNGVWSWSLLKQDFLLLPYPIKIFFQLFQNDDIFTILNFLRLFSALLFFYDPLRFYPAIFLLFFIHILTCIRWRGTFNGGSDFMSTLFFLALILQPLSTNAALGILAIQSVNSYLIAGLVKLKSPSWREGRAIKGFLRHGIYKSQKIVSLLESSPMINRLLTWTVLFFECTFPLSLYSSKILLIYLVFGFFFHLLNAFFLGLNRFFFTWIGTYPALYYFSQKWSA